MRILVIGAGAIGRVLATHLHSAGVEVALLSRRPLAGPVVIERVDSQSRLQVVALRTTTQFAPGADWALACLPAESLTAEVLDDLDRLRAPVAIMQPLLPSCWQRICGRLGTRANAAVPGIAGYVRPDGVVRYWLPKAAPTLLDANLNVSELTALLEKSGLPAREEPDMAGTSQALTAVVVPWMMALAATGSIAAALADRELLALAVRASSESRKLAMTLGRLPTWVSGFTKFMGARMIKIGAGIAKKVSPEVLDYLDAQFAVARRGTAGFLGAELVRETESRGLEANAIRALHLRHAT